MKNNITPPNRPGLFGAIRSLRGLIPSRTFRLPSFIFKYFSLIIGLLWLVPIIVLLWLNFSGYVIGASVWCPFNDCNIKLRGIYGSYDYTTAGAFDKRDHDALGALQLVSKALEIWFGFIATSLVYWMGQWLNSQIEGVPVGLLSTHVAYADPLTFLHQSYWTAPQQPASKSYLNSRSLRLYIFMFFSLAMCGLYNLMGPSVAVLTLPTLQWVDKPALGQVFGGYNLGSSPSASGDMVERTSTRDSVGCTELELKVREYGCLYPMSYTNRWDGIVADIAADWQQLRARDFNYTRPFITSAESGLTFSFNSTRMFAYTPTRQTMRLLSQDVETTLREWNSSNKNPPRRTARQSKNLREGPVPVALSHSLVGIPMESSIRGDSAKRVHCIHVKYYNGENDEHYQCFRVGSAWNLPHDSQASFSFDAMEILPDKRPGAYVQTSIYSVDSMAKFTNKLPSCLAPNSTIECNFDKWFAQKENQLYIEVCTDRHEHCFIQRTFIRTTMAIHAVNMQSPVYLVETSLYDMPKINEVNQKLDFSAFKNNEGRPVALHADWLLAAWSMDQGSTAGAIRTARRVYALNVLNFLNDTKIDANYDKGLLSYSTLSRIVMHSALQGMSLVPWTDGGTTKSQALPESTSPSGNDGPDSQSQILKRYASEQVWAYSLEARTAKLGVTVAIVGILITLIRTCVCLRWGTHGYSSVDLFQAVLQQPYKGEFDGVEKKDVSKVRMRLLYENEVLEIKNVPGGEYKTLMRVDTAYSSHSAASATDIVVETKDVEARQ